MDSVQESNSSSLRLQLAVTSVQQQVRRQLWLQGIGNYLVLMLSVVLLLGLVDFSLRPQGPSLRFTSTLLALFAALWGGVKFLLPAVTYAPTLVDIACRIERHAPNLRNRLSSALAFLGASQQASDLQSAVIEETADMLDEINIDTCVDATASRRTSIIVATVMVASLLISLADFQTSHLALKRLLLPWVNAEWPRLHVLRFEDPPQQVAHGQDLELILVDRNGPLPRQVSLQYRYAGDSSSQLHTETLDVETGPARFQLKNITQPLQFRAMGGDDHTMDWSTVRVVDPPRIESFLIRLHPPAYTGWPLQRADQAIRALVGTRIEFGAYSNKPLMNVVLRSAADDLPFDIWTRLDEERHVFVLPANSELPWTVKQTGTFWFELTDQTDIRGGSDRRFSVEAIPDQPPNITLTTPIKDLRVTALARLPLQLIVKEDLAIRDIYLQYHRGDTKGEPEKMFLQRSAAQVSTAAAQRSLANLESGKSSADVRHLSHTWNLESIPELTLGTTLTCSVIATDYLPQQGKSTPLRLTIISIAELERLIRLQRTEVLEKLSKVLMSQRELHRQLETLTAAFQTPGDDPPGRIDRLQGIELRQRQIGSQLNGNYGSVNVRIETILQHIQVNHLVRPATAERMRQWLKAIKELTAEKLPAIRTLLLTALKTAQDNNNGRDTVSLLNQAQHYQESIIELLISIQTEFVQREDYHKLSLQLRLLLEQQTALQQSTRQLELTLLETTGGSLQDDEQEQISLLTGQQVNLVHYYQRLFVKMQQANNASASVNWPQSTTLEEALRTARRHGIDTLLSASAEALRRNQLGRSSQQQQLALERIQEVLEILLQEQARLLLHTSQPQQQLAQQLSQLAEKQQNIKNRISDSRDDALTALSTSQRILSGDARLLGQQLGQFRITESSATVSRAVEKMETVRQALDQAARTAAKNAAEATVQLLQQAKTELRNAVRQTPPAISWTGELLRSLRESHSRQSQILEQTRELMSSHDRQSSWSAKQKTTLETLLRSQRELTKDTRAQKWSLPPVFSARLDRVTDQMARVAEHLRRMAPDHEFHTSKQVQRRILRGLAEMIAALETEHSTPDSPPIASPSRPDSGAESNTIQPNHMRAQLRLLQTWQQQVFDQTATLTSRHRQQGKLSELETQQLKELAETQKQLGTLALMLSKQSDAPSKIPTTDSSKSEGSSSSSR